MRWPQFLIGGLLLIALLLGLLLSFPLALMRPAVLPGTKPWPGPAGTRWAGTELQGMEVWQGGEVSSTLLELRCVARPSLKTRLDYWPGPEWNGWAEWRADKVVYLPGWGEKVRPKSLKNPVSIAAPAWLRWCPK